MKTLLRNDWANDVKKAINDFLLTYKNNSNLNKDYVVFDFDNTCSIFDSEETTLKYQLNVMKQLIASINEGNKLQFANAAAKERTLKLAEHYVDTYYGSLTYIAKGYKAATNLMEIFVDAYNGYDFAVKNADADYVEKFAAKVENLKVILTAAEDAIKEVKDAELNGTETKEFNELKAEFDAAKEAFNKLAK